MEGRKRRSFSKEFKAEAVRLCKAGDRTIAQVAKGLDLTETAAREWVKRADTRSGVRDTFEVIEELKAHGCEVVSVADGFDLAGPAAEVVLAVMAWAAKMERLAINERISASRERIESEGKNCGRPSRGGR